MTTFSYNPPPNPTRCSTRPKVSPSSESQPSSSEAETQLTDFFQIPKTPPRTLPVHDVIHILRSHLLSGVSIVTSLNDTSAPRAPEHLRSGLRQTNPCAKWKVLSLTKPKGKIYKTKSLGHYITLWAMTMKEYFIHARFLELMSHHQVHFKNWPCVISCPSGGVG